MINRLGRAALVSVAPLVLGVAAGAPTAAGAAAPSIVLSAVPSTAWSTGDNAYGQLGTGDAGASTSTVPTPVALPSGTTIVSAAAGDSHTVALSDTGTVYAWGRGASGALGNGATANSATPVQVPLPQTATQVAAGVGFSLALTTAGQVYAWGDDSQGQLGIGRVDQNGIATPQLVGLPAGTTITDVSAGADFAIALGSNGAVYTWGDNVTGQLGDNTATSRTSPVTVALPSGVTVTGVAAGSATGYALTSAGRVLAWGAGRAGQLGDGFGLTSVSPVYVLLPSGVTATAVVGGGGFAYALGTTGRLYAWGGGNFDDLGDASTTDQLTPITVGFPAGTSIVGAAGGSGYGYALDSAGGAWSWGLNSYGQLGEGTTATQPTPAHVSLPSGSAIAAVSAGGQHAVLIAQAPPTVSAVTPSVGSAGGGTAITVTGRNFTGSSTVAVGGTSATVTARTPSRLTAVTPPGTAGVVDVTVTNAGGTSSLAPPDRFEYLATGSVVGWGAASSGSLGDGVTGPEQVLSPSPAFELAGHRFTSYAVGDFATYGLTAAGTVYATGDDSVDELGDNRATRSAVPVRTALPAGVVITAIAAGDENGYALSRSGRVYAWGYNRSGAVGNGTSTQSSGPAPVQLPAGVKVAQIAAGLDFALARTTTGALYAWGSDFYGQLGDGSTASALTPVAVHLPAGTTVSDVAAGYDHALAVTSTGAVLAWGSNSHGELGDGTQTARGIPVRTNLAKGTIVRQVAAGSDDSLALTSAGRVLAWGYNAYGALGDATTTDRATPVSVHLATGISITQLAVGTSHVLARASTGALYAWGFNAQGELGVGTTATHLTPTRVTLPAGFGVAHVCTRGYFTVAVLSATA